MDQLSISNNQKESRFETVVDGQTAFASYTLRPGSIVFTHTEVPPELSRRGIASQLARAALEHARAEKLKVVPACSFIARFIERNQDYKVLVEG